MPCNRKIVIHKETKRVMRIKSGAIVFRRDGCGFTLTIAGQRVATSQFIDQALEPMENRRRAADIKAAMEMERVDDPRDLNELFRGWPTVYGNS